MSISSDLRGAIPGVCLARALVVSYTATEIGENHVRRIERRSKQHTIRRFDIAVLHPTPMEVIEGTGGLLTYLANAFMRGLSMGLIPCWKNENNLAHAIWLPVHLNP